MIGFDGALLAQRTERLRQIGEGMQQGSSLSSFLMLLVGLVAFVALLMLARKYFGDEQSPRDASPDFLHLACRELGLTDRERLALRELARRAGAREPAAMLLSPRNLAQALHKAGVRGENSTLPTAVSAICTKLFGTPLPELPKPTDAPEPARIRQ